VREFEERHAPRRGWVLSLESCKSFPDLSQRLDKKFSYSSHIVFAGEKAGVTGLVPNPTSVLGIFRAVLEPVLSLYQLLNSCNDCLPLRRVRLSVQLNRASGSPSSANNAMPA
jgi:hypothetical protein